MTVNEIRELLRQRRIDLGLSQQALGDLMHSSQGRIADLEAGRYAPELRTLQWWARSLGLKLELNLH